MRTVTTPGPVHGAPYFLISYSHTERNGRGPDRDADNWVIKFFRDLGRKVAELANVPAGNAWASSTVSSGWRMTGSKASRKRCQHVVFSVVIPWNPDDRGTVAKTELLRSALGEALPSTLEQGRVTSAAAVDGVPTLEAFRNVLPALIPVAGKRYLKHAATHPPKGQVVEKPTFHGFMPNPPSLMERSGG